MEDRVIKVDGAVNLRDFGGYKTEAGEAVRRGLLFRSGTLHFVTDEGVAQFADLDIRLICDLRRPDEKEKEPTAIPHEDTKRLEIPIDPGSAVELRERLADDGLSYNDRVRYMTLLTGELTRDHAADYEKMFEAILQMPTGGFLVHCSAGKDRTGVACALMLHALGVPKDTVLDDYLFTNIAIDYENHVLPRMLERFDYETVPDKEMVMTLAGVREEYLQAAYHAIEQHFDDIEHFIEDALGLGQQERARLRDRYLVS